MDDIEPEAFILAIHAFAGIFALVAASYWFRAYAAWNDGQKGAAEKLPDFASHTALGGSMAAIALVLYVVAGVFAGAS